MAKGTSPAATAAADPADDPLEPRAGFQGVRVLPPNQSSPYASSPIESLASSTAPDSRSRAATTESKSRTWFSKGFAPKVVRVPFAAEKIFQSVGNSVQRSAPHSCRALGVPLRGFGQRDSLLHERDDAVQPGSVLFESAEIDLVSSTDVTLPALSNRASSSTVAKSSASGPGSGPFESGQTVFPGAGGGGSGANVKAGGGSPAMAPWRGGF